MNKTLFILIAFVHWILTFEVIRSAKITTDISLKLKSRVLFMGHMTPPPPQKKQKNNNKQTKKTTTKNNNNNKTNKQTDKQNKQKHPQTPNNLGSSFW